MSKRTVLVTGANRGLGRAISAHLYELGYRVVVAARDERSAQKVAAELGEDASAVVLDVTDTACVEQARERAGEVDILVNNAGVLLDWGQRALSVPLDLIEQELAVNALGAWRVAQAFLPGMLERSWGRVVNVSSGTGSFTWGLFADAPGYAVSKAALNAVTILLANDTRGKGVLVNAVNPGLVRTRMRPDAQRLPQEAAVDIAWAATLPDDGPTGMFFRGREVMGW